LHGDFDAPALAGRLGLVHAHILIVDQFRCELDLEIGCLQVQAGQEVGAQADFRAV
jgi:hypothetical protein